jgi:hypothetical protein
MDKGGRLTMCKKVNFSIPAEVDNFLTSTKEATGLPKSQILSFLVMRHGEELAKDLSKFSRKEEALSTIK